MAANTALKMSWDAYSGAAAPARRPETPSYAPRLQVHEGAGRDARARKGISATLHTAFRVALLAGACFFVLGLARVGMCAQAVTTLEANSALKQEVSSAQDANRQLKIEVNALSNNSRIATLAAQNYHMVYAGAGETLHVEVPTK